MIIKNYDGDDVQLIQVYMDYDGSVHINQNEEVKDGRIYYLERDVPSVPFLKILKDLENGIPVYNHRLSNCKHFMERISKILFHPHIYNTKYLQILHRRRKIKTYANVNKKN